MLISKLPAVGQLNNILSDIKVAECNVIATACRLLDSKCSCRTLCCVTHG